MEYQVHLHGAYGINARILIRTGSERGRGEGLIRLSLHTVLIVNLLSCDYLDRVLDH